MAKMEFIKELWEFMKVRKAYWLTPIILILMLFGAMLFLTQTSAVAPFVYTLF